MSKIDLLKPAINQIKKEDFTIGVGAPTGLNQGIPTSGDAIGVMPVLVGSTPIKHKKRKIITNKRVLNNHSIINDNYVDITFPKIKSFIDFIKDKT